MYYSLSYYCYNFSIDCKNGRADLIVLLVGLIPFIPVSTIIMVYNGALLGSFTALGSMITSRSILESALFGVAPHGILEYTLNCIAFALSIYLCKTVTYRIRKKEGDSVKTAFLNCLRVFVLIVLPGLLICAIIESNITPLIMQAVGMI